MLECSTAAVAAMYTPVVAVAETRRWLLARLSCGCGCGCQHQHGWLALLAYLCSLADVLQPNSGSYELNCDANNQEYGLLPDTSHW